jgi:hypothetical protein
MEDRDTRCYSTDDPVKHFDTGHDLIKRRLKTQNIWKGSNVHPYGEIPNVPPCDIKPMNTSILFADDIIDPSNSRSNSGDPILNPDDPLPKLSKLQLAFQETQS